MKYRAKLITLAAAVTGAAALCNRFIFARAASPAPKAHYYKWRHGRIHYKVSGTGEPLLLLHSTAAGASSLEWRRVMARLSRKYTVYALDFLGFGCSDKPNITYSAYLYVSLVNEFIRDVIGRSCFVAGSRRSSSYAVIGCQLDMTLYRKIILVSPEEIAPPFVNTDALEYKLAKLYTIPVFGTSAYAAAVSRKNIAAFLREKLLTNDKKTLKSLVDDLYRAAHHGGAAARYAYAAVRSGVMDAGTKNRPERLVPPFLVIRGQRGADGISDISPTLVGYGLASRQRIINKSGDFPHIDRPEDFCAEVEKFLS